MNPPSSSPLINDPYPSALYRGGHCHRTFSWGAVFAGLTAATAFQVLFMMLGAGLGFAIYSPLTDENPIADLGKGAIIIQGVSAVFSLWFGGWIAGRFTPVGARRSGGLHGLVVWCAATVAGVMVVSTGAGWALGDLSKLVGGGLSLAGKPAAAIAGGATDAVKDAVKKNTDTLSSFVDEAVGSRTSNATPAATTRAKREIAFALGRLFKPGQTGDVAANREAAVKVLVETGGINRADAERMISEWTDSYNRLKADLETAKNEAEAKARVAADKAADALALFSLASFVAFVIGAISASCGGRHGAKCATRCETRADVAL